MEGVVRMGGWSGRWPKDWNVRLRFRPAGSIVRRRFRWRAPVRTVDEWRVTRDGTQAKRRHDVQERYDGCEEVRTEERKERI
eukprot:6213441-Pleurochrysis_carterae.AAC.1